MKLELRPTLTQKIEMKKEKRKEGYLHLNRSLDASGKRKLFAKSCDIADSKIAEVLFCSLYIQCHNKRFYEIYYENDKTGFRTF